MQKHNRHTTHTGVPTHQCTCIGHVRIQMMLHLFNVRRCRILLGQCFLKVGCLLNGIQQELNFNVTFSGSHLLAKLDPAFDPGKKVHNGGILNKEQRKRNGTKLLSLFDGGKANGSQWGAPRILFRSLRGINGWGHASVA